MKIESRRKNTTLFSYFTIYSFKLRTHCLFVCLFVLFPAVLMWEVFTEGRMPFEQSQNHEVVTLVTKGHRLYRPKMATPTIYDIMQLCWHEVRAQRLGVLRFLRYF